MEAKPQKRPRGLACLECGAPLKVCRTDRGDGYVLRRRECPCCRRRFTTKERFVNRSDDGPADVEGLAAFSIAKLLRQEGYFADRPACDRPESSDSP